MKLTKPQATAQISDADRKRKIILITLADKCTGTMTLKKWREKGPGESIRTRPPCQ
jgi:hypothetical protein